MYDYSSTTLIVGAGAHIPYRYPSGAELRESILSLHKNFQAALFQAPRSAEDTRRIRDLIVLANQKGFFGDEMVPADNFLNDFVADFARSHMLSIDAFLGSSQVDEKMGKLGKLLIAYFIVKSELSAPTELRGTSNWIEIFINRYLGTKDNVDSFITSDIDIYTFNYDLLFEMKLFQHLVYQHGYGRDHARKYIEDLNIRHIYGKIGTVTDRPKKQFLNDYIVNHANEISVIGEERSDLTTDVLSKKVGSSLLNSRKVFFLGFGFDETNTELIFRHFRQESKARFFSTNKGLMPADFYRITSQIENSPKYIEFYFTKKSYTENLGFEKIYSQDQLRYVLRNEAEVECHTLLNQYDELFDFS